MTRVDLPPAELSIGPREAIAALRTLRFGGGDASTLTLEVSPSVRAATGPMINAARFGALLFGMVFAVPDAVDGSVAAAGSVAVAVWWTTWRSFRPLVLASSALGPRAFAIVDAIVFAIGAALSGALVSPFAPTIVVAVAVAAFGWGIMLGSIAAVAGLVASVVTAELLSRDPELGSQQALSVIAATAAVVIVASVVQTWMRDAERRRRALAEQVESLAETNDLLAMLNRAARVLPGRLDPREVGDAIAGQLRAAFAPAALAVLDRDSGGTHTRLVASGTALASLYTDDALPPALATIAAADDALLFELDGETVLGQRLGTRDRPVGLVVMWAPRPSTWTERDRRALSGLQEVFALSVDNARRFGQLRALGAADERERVARELHDRLGQVLTVVSMELERVIDGGGVGDLERVYDDVQRSIDELRSTLRMLRMNISDEEGLADRARQLAQDVRMRTGVDVRFAVDGAGPRPPVGVEQEFLRIMQEAINNAVKHAEPQHIDVRLVSRPGAAALTIADDGSGFDLGRPTRADAWGLLGMRERAASIDADLELVSEPGAGTTITIDWTDDV